MSTHTHTHTHTHSHTRCGFKLHPAFLFIQKSINCVTSRGVLKILPGRQKSRTAWVRGVLFLFRSTFRGQMRGAWGPKPPLSPMLVAKPRDGATARVGVPSVHPHGGVGAISTWGRWLLGTSKTSDSFHLIMKKHSDESFDHKSNNLVELVPPCHGHPLTTAVTCWMMTAVTFSFQHASRMATAVWPRKMLG